MKFTAIILSITLFAASCGGGDNKDRKATPADSEEKKGQSSWTEERKKEEIKNCITSLSFKAKTDSLPDELKQKICDCSVNTKMSRYPDAENANINMASELGVTNMQQFRDSCVSLFLK